MKKNVLYIVPACLLAAMLAILLAGYFVYETNPDLSCSMWVPIGFSLAAGLLFALQIFLTIKNKYAWALTIAVVKYVVLWISVSFVFKSSLLGVMFSILLPVIGPVIALTALASRWMILLFMILLHIGVILEIILLTIYSYQYKKENQNKPQISNS